MTAEEPQPADEAADAAGAAGESGEADEAARPAKVPYVYYVARNDGTGRHYFSPTPEQFDADVTRSKANAAG